MQVSSFLMKNKHLTSGQEQKLCCVSSDPLAISLVNVRTWHLFTPMALDSYWHRKGPSLASGKTAGALEREKSRAEGGRMGWDREQDSSG